VRRFMRQIPPVELELMLAASSMSDRSENFHRLVADAGIDPGSSQTRVHFMEELQL